MKFKIVVPFYNSKWVKKCIESIKTQTFKDFVCLIINDNSSLDNEKEIKQIIDGDERFFYSRNSSRLYALENIYHGLNFLYQEDKYEENVAMIIDGDDWLANEHSLQKVADAYETTGCMITHGSWDTHPVGHRDEKMNSQHTTRTIKNRDFRYCDWRSSQLRTFKYSLWNKINKSDLMNKDGFYKTTYDLAIMFPMLEMAPNHICHIKDNIYIYNVENDINDHKVNRKLQLSLETEIRNKKRYPKIY